MLELVCGIYKDLQLQGLKPKQGSKTKKIIYKGLKPKQTLKGGLVHEAPTM